ncbi:hypothetical protein VNI00_018656 [Paramarasmius palmivorus]|uniref:Uncharacterized protein n=1 Tax=Paramarasmius palmivorus TaxID=297713 RepID=A0AAW0AY60_9AGAR
MPSDPPLPPPTQPNICQEASILPHISHPVSSIIRLLHPPLTRFTLLPSRFPVASPSSCNTPPKRYLSSNSAVAFRFSFPHWDAVPPTSLQYLCYRSLPSDYSDIPSLRPAELEASYPTTLILGALSPRRTFRSYCSSSHNASNPCLSLTPIPDTPISCFRLTYGFRRRIGYEESQEDNENVTVSRSYNEGRRSLYGRGLE